jgi:long-chain fatty acid transport protein
MSKLTRFAVTVIVASSVCVCSVRSVMGLGFRTPDQNAAATGQGEAFVAQADDASAVYYNPAGLTQLQGTHVAAGAYVSFPNIRFSGAFASEKMNSASYTPHFYAASDLGTEKWRFGVGLNVPFGNSVEYNRNGPFQFLVTESSLVVLNIAPTIAYRVNEHLSIGGGVNVYHGDTELKFNYLPFFGGRFRFEGDGQAVGGTVGVLWTINEQHSVGVVYRTPFEIDFKGSAVVKEPPPPFVLPDPGPSSASAEIEFPQSVAVGYAFRPNKKLKLEVDVEWTNWDTLNTVQLRSPNPFFAGDPRSTIPFHWEDSFFYEFGAQYELTENWKVRAGYIFSENTVPESTFAPIVPDSDRHVFSVGAGYSTKSFNVDVAYQYSLSEDRTVDSSGVLSPFGLNGKWKSDAHAVILSGAWKF